MALLGTMFTFTTYGTWLRGDRRGWVEQGQILPPNPELERADRSRMPHAPFVFERDDLLRVGAMIGESLQSRLAQPVLALTVNTWHVHLVVSAVGHEPAMIVKCAKEAVRYGLKPGRPIWTDAYEKRFCFDEVTLDRRIEYVERHNIALGWPARPWPFIVSFR
jgi:hypothetical protein